MVMKRRTLAACQNSPVLSRVLEKRQQRLLEKQQEIPSVSIDKKTNAALPATLVASSYTTVAGNKLSDEEEERTGNKAEALYTCFFEILCVALRNYVLKENLIAVATSNLDGLHYLTIIQAALENNPSLLGNKGAAEILIQAAKNARHPLGHNNYCLINSYWQSYIYSWIAVANLIEEYDAADEMESILNQLIQDDNQP